MRSLAVVACLATAACSGDDPTPFNLDVVVYDTSVQLWLRDFAEAPCSRTTRPKLQFPRPGECTQHDILDSCGDDRPTCFTRVAIERDGFQPVLAELLQSSNVIDLHRMDLFTGGDVDLVIEGCGAEDRIPLTRNALQALTITDLTTDGMTIRGTTAPTGATGLVALTSDGFSDRSCHEASDTSWHVLHPADPRNTDHYSVGVGSVVASGTVAIPWGEAQIWNATPGSGFSIMLPTWKGDRWEISDQHDVGLVMAVDGTPRTGAVWSAWGFRETAGGTRIYISNEMVEYAAGETTDTLTIVGADGRFIGTFPHVMPSNDLDMGLEGADLLVDITLPTVTVTHENNRSLTHQVSFSARWDHWLIPRLVP